jgi:HK97 family phage major capsid protein
VDLTESNVTATKASLSPKRGGTFVDISNQLLRQSSPDVEQLIINDILSATQVGIEKAAISGSGSSGVPEGILNTSGIGVVYSGGAAASGTNANGAAQVWNDWINLETEVAVDNADIGSLAYLTNSKVRGSAKQIKIDAGSGLFIWNPNQTEVNGYRVGVTNAVPSNLVKGASGATLSANIFGNFSDLFIGQWGGLEVLMDPYTQSIKGLTRMTINAYVDVAVRRPVSFAAVKDIVA